MMDNKITNKAKKIKSRKKNVKKIKFVILVLLLLLALLYLVVSLIYNKGNFSITLDENLYYEKDLIIYDNVDYKVYRSELFAEAPETFDNISYKWLPDDINQYEGSHNGKNYLAYSFYIENVGDKETDYWSEIIVSDVIKNVDEAVRIRIYKDDSYITYAKAKKDGTPERDTVPFVSDDLVALDHVDSFKPGDRIKYTIVLWLEGSDLECTDNILGGEFKVQMNFNSEVVTEIEGEEE